MAASNLAKDSSVAFCSPMMWPDCALKPMHPNAASSRKICMYNNSLDKLTEIGDWGHYLGQNQMVIDNGGAARKYTFLWMNVTYHKSYFYLMCWITLIIQHSVKIIA